jgi:hypothetical protein
MWRGSLGIDSLGIRIYDGIIILGFVGNELTPSTKVFNGRYKKGGCYD